VNNAFNLQVPLKNGNFLTITAVPYAKFEVSTAPVLRALLSYRDMI
jgi:hypothetical protein